MILCVNDKMELRRHAAAIHNNISSPGVIFSEAVVFRKRSSKDSCCFQMTCGWLVLEVRLSNLECCLTEDAWSSSYIKTWSSRSDTWSVVFWAYLRYFFSKSGYQTWDVIKRRTPGRAHIVKTWLSRSETWSVVFWMYFRYVFYIL